MEKVKDLLHKLFFTRAGRLLLWSLLIALIFPPARLLVIVILYIVVLFAAIDQWWKQGKKIYTLAIIISILIFGAIKFIAFGDVFFRVYSFYHNEENQLKLDDVQDGIYSASAIGFRGDISVKVKVENNKIADILVMKESETVSIGTSAINKLREEILTTNNPNVEDITGATWSSFGFKAAVINALWKGVPNAPTPNPITRLYFWIASNHFYRITFNTLAVLFIIVIVFDYSIASALNKDIGHSLNCMNCQTCVGACPVKVVEGDVAYPMEMILMARLGDYERVEELAKYCVGCSRCAGKCPIGLSAPSIAASCIEFLHKQRIAKKEEKLIKT